MLPEDIDALFRNQLDGHQSPPDADLWARLQALPPSEASLPATEPGAQITPDAEAQRLDELFRSRLSTHASAVPRQLWERLEDEHLRLRKRRAAAWWPLAVAAVVALFIMAGGVLLWGGNPLRPGSGPGQLATAKKPVANPAATSPAAASEAGRQVAATAKTEARTIKKQAFEKNSTAQATELAAVSSSVPEGQPAVATAALATHPAAHFGQSARSAHASTVAMLAPLRARRSGPTAAPLAGPAAHLPATGAKQVATGPARQPDTPPVTPPVPAPAAPATDVASTGIIEVEVRRGGVPATSRPAPAPVAVVAAAPAESRSGVGRQLGGLFSRATGAVRLAKDGLAVAQNIPDNLTVQAHVGRRTLSKTIDL